MKFNVNSFNERENRFKLYLNQLLTVQLSLPIPSFYK